MILTYTTLTTLPCPWLSTSGTLGSRFRLTSTLAYTVLMSPGLVSYLLTPSFGLPLLETLRSISLCRARLSNRKSHTAHLSGDLISRNMFNCSNPSALVSGGGSSGDAIPLVTPYVQSLNCLILQTSARFIILRRLGLLITISTSRQQDFGLASNIVPNSWPRPNVLIRCLPGE